MTALYVLIAICCALSLVAAVLSFLIYKKSKQNAISAESELQEQVTNTIRQENGMLTGAINAQSGYTRDLTGRFDNFMINVDRKLDDIKSDNSKNIAYVREENSRTLDAVRKDNAEQLEKMRATVDEKLATTLEQRFNDSFKLVGARLQEINVTFNALQGLQSDVNDLNKIFKNVKTRGTWGEVSLDSLLSQILTPDQYVKQARFTRGAGEDLRVDFAIKMPGQGDGTVFLPIDAKFPLEDYQRLVEASAQGDTAAIEIYSKALGDAVLKQARSIRDKYIRPPKTTDFAVMYLPIEGLYAEIVKHTDLLSKLQMECRVVVCGPTTLSALLNSLRMGFRSVAIEKRSKEIAVLLGQFQKDFGIFSKYLSQIKMRVGSMQKSIDDAERKSASIGTKLSKVTKIKVDSEDIDLIGGLDEFDEVAADILDDIPEEEDEG